MGAEVRISIMVALILGLCTSIQASDWIDQGDGTWQLSVTYTVTTTAHKDLYEQCRKWDNQRYRYAEDQLDASEWFEAMFMGLDITQEDTTLYPGPVKNYIQGIINDFYYYWVPGAVEDKMTYAIEQVTIPDPPNQP
jgi:hypothetical protein